MGEGEKGGKEDAEWRRRERLGSRKMKWRRARRGRRRRNDRMTVEGRRGGHSAY